MKKKFYLALIILAIMATPHFITQARISRGYIAIGGEVLLAPLALLIILCIEQVRAMYLLAFKEGEEEDE